MVYAIQYLDYFIRIFNRKNKRSAPPLGSGYSTNCELCDTHWWVAHISLVIILWLWSWSFTTHGDVLFSYLLLWDSSLVILTVVIGSVWASNFRRQIVAELNSSVAFHQQSLRLNSALLNDRLNTSIAIPKIVLQWDAVITLCARQKCLRDVFCAWGHHIPVHTVVLILFKLLQLLLTNVLRCIVIQLGVVFINFR